MRMLHKAALAPDTARRQWHRRQAGRGQEAWGKSCRGIGPRVGLSYAHVLRDPLGLSYAYV